MHDILTVVGARPQFVKAAMVSRALARVGVSERLVHTGQHYDDELSAVFFRDLGLPEPEINLDVGSASHARQTGEIMMRLEKHLSSGARPDCVLVFGDTNSTIAAAVTARKLHLPVAHVEAGLRSFNSHMPEEINRIVTDRLSDFLFAPTPAAVRNLSAEGLSGRVHETGDVMREAAHFFADLVDAAALDLPGEPFYLATVHRAENTDDVRRLAGILQGLGNIGHPVVFLAHPRTRPLLSAASIPGNVLVRPPASYAVTLGLAGKARRVLTDSGGLQKEAVWLGTPCVTLRDETEWEETREGGWNLLAGADPQAIAAAVAAEPNGPPPDFGTVSDGPASELIASILASA